MIKVLVVDDSVVIRMALEKVLSSNENLKIVGFCSNGEDVFEKIELFQPDVITLDIEMPKMNGLEVLEKLMNTTPIPVIMVSSLTNEGSIETIKALELGAIDVFLKPKAKNTSDIKKGFEGIIEKIFLAANAKIISSSPPKLIKNILNEKIIYETKEKQIRNPSYGELNKNKFYSDFKPEIVSIGISTGGPASLNKIIPKLPVDFPCSVVIAQHMPPSFTKSLAIRLNQISQIEVKEIENNEVIKQGMVYIAPSGFQTRIKRKFGQLVFNVEEDFSKEFLFKPCIDVLFSSISEHYKEKALAIVMTGMGNDGTKGSEQIKNSGGKVFAQSEETCVIGSMPKSVVNAGLADEIYDLDFMIDGIMKFF